MEHFYSDFFPPPRVGIGVGAMKKVGLCPEVVTGKRTRENRTDAPQPGVGEELGLRDPIRGDRDSVLLRIRLQKSIGYHCAA